MMIVCRQFLKVTSLLQALVDANAGRNASHQSLSDFVQQDVKGSESVATERGRVVQLVHKL